ncbi:MAG: SRPBCC domain-containing protein [Hyphomicrobiales bacterium]
MSVKSRNSEGGFVFRITHLADAPRELVWDVFTKPEHLKHWWGPEGFMPSHCTVDLRPGGRFHYRLSGESGPDMWGKLEFLEIAPPERMVGIVSFSDPQGGITVHPMNPDWPRRILSTTTFTEKGGKTEVTVTWVAYEPTEIERKTFEDGRNDMRAGFGGTFVQLDAYLAALKEQGSQA